MKILPIAATAMPMASATICSPAFSRRCCPPARNGCLPQAGPSTPATGDIGVDIPR